MSAQQIFPSSSSSALLTQGRYVCPSSRCTGVPHKVLSQSICSSLLPTLWRISLKVCTPSAIQKGGLLHVYFHMKLILIWSREWAAPPTSPFSPAGGSSEPNSCQPLDVYRLLLKHTGIKWEFLCFSLRHTSWESLFHHSLHTKRLTSDCNREAAATQPRSNS